MSTNYPDAGNYSSAPKNDNKNTIIILLAIALVGSWIYFMYAKSQTTAVITEKDAQYATLDSARNNVQKEFDDAIVRLDEMTATNNGLDSLVKTRDNELGILKSKFKSLVSKQNASSADLAAGIAWIYNYPDKAELNFNARQTVEDYFSEGTIAGQHIELYKSLLDNHVPA